MKLANWGVLRGAVAVIMALIIAFALATYWGLGAWSKALPLEPVSIVTKPVNSNSEVAPMVDSSVVYQHSLFTPDRGIDTDSFQNVVNSDDGQSQNLNTQNLNLLSVMITPALTVAVFSRAAEKPFRVKLGETLPSSNLVFTRAQPRAVVLSGGGSDVTLMLRIFDGQGGVSPSATPALNNTPSIHAPNTDTLPINTQEVISEVQLRQQLAQKRAELQQQNSQDQKP